MAKLLLEEAGAAGAAGSCGVGCSGKAKGQGTEENTTCHKRHHSVLRVLGRRAPPHLDALALHLAPLPTKTSHFVLPLLYSHRCLWVCGFVGRLSLCCAIAGGAGRCNGGGSGGIGGAV
jgi:hypothetical protein